MAKCLRSDYFRLNPAVKAARHGMGCEKFDAMYHKLYLYLSGLHIGQWFTVSKVCRNDPGNHSLVLMMCDIYRHMDYFVNLEYDKVMDRVTILPTLDGRTEGAYSPPDIYGRIVKSPKEWGCCPDDI